MKILEILKKIFDLMTQKNQKESKFIQIFKVQYGNLFALDENGRVWEMEMDRCYIDFREGWKLLTNKRLTEE